MLDNNTKAKLNTIWNTLFNSGMPNTFSIIEQISYLIFIKNLDDIQIQDEQSSAALSFLFDDDDEDEDFQFDPSAPVFDELHASCRWHIFRDYSADKMYKNMQEKVFPFITEQIAITQKTAFSSYIKGAKFKIPTAAALHKVVHEMDSLDFTINNKESAIEMYNYLLSKLSPNGIAGQFRTPKHIVKLMVDLVQPTLEDSICDPAMGTGSFLSETAQFITDHNPDLQLNVDKKNYYSANMFSGIEIDKTMFTISALNLMLNDVSAPALQLMDALSNNNPAENMYSLILSNPPFSGAIDTKYTSDSLQSGAETKNVGILFFKLVLRMLKPGGRCAMIVPDNLLFGVSRAHVVTKEELIEKNKLEAIISLPKNLFYPFASVSTSIIVFRKTLNGGTDNVWYYDLQDSNTEDVLSRFRNISAEEGRSRTDYSFLVTKDEIVSNNYMLLMERYRKKREDISVHQSPNIALNELLVLNDILMNQLDKLE